jgi:hypothetical protein
MSDSERARLIKDKIRRHLDEVGASGWKIVRTECPEVSDATFWRYIKAVREEGNKEGASDEAVTGPTPKVDEDIPRLGALPAFYNPLQKARKYEALLADAEALRAHAVDPRGKVTNARLLEKSIVLRERLLSQQAEIMDYFQSQQAMRLFCDEIVEMTMDFPEASVRKLMTRLHEQQERLLAATHV